MEIFLSKTEAEYIALSQATRELLPMREMLRELSGYFKLPKTDIVTRCTVFEDNTGAEELAQTEKYRPRTKHIAVKYHHFRDKVRDGSITIERIDTKQQLADILTKGLAKPQFEKLRERLNGWCAMLTRPYSADEKQAYQIYSLNWC